AGYNKNGWEARALDRLLRPPLRGAAKAVIGRSGELINRAWCSDVVAEFDRRLAGKYPFRRKATSEALVADLEQFFKPTTGVLWEFYTKALANDLEHPASTTTFRHKEGATAQYRPALFAFLARAEELTDLVFSKEQAKIGFSYGVRIRSTAPYSRIVF